MEQNLRLADGTISGQGHESGSEGLYEYMEKKLVSIGGL